MSSQVAASLFSVANKNVLVTGGSRGIGFMIAKGYVQAGANVILTSRDEKACAEAAATLQCQYVTSNVSTREGCEALAQNVSDMFQKRLDVLVNNAGTSWGQPLDRESKTNWGFDKVFDLVSIFLCSSLVRYTSYCCITISHYSFFSKFPERQGFVLSYSSLFASLGRVGNAR
jgi:NAD(P)-dependent dehydrogenase (short-subunit alcohol dehydrogenase family)